MLPPSPLTAVRWAHAAVVARHRPGRARGDLGEGVISAAIAVLIMAFLGAVILLVIVRVIKGIAA